MFVRSGAAFALAAIFAFIDAVQRGGDLLPYVLTAAWAGLAIASLVTYRRARREPQEPGPVGSAEKQ